MTVLKALAALKRGEVIILYDGDEREGEADMVFHANFVTPSRIKQLRKEAGGLICLALGKRIAEKLQLPFLSDILQALPAPVSNMVVKRTAYGDRPAFSIPINHRKVYTGIPDNDRALTIRKMAELVGNGRNGRPSPGAFQKNFYTPGHVFLLIGRGLQTRRGHTELSLALAAQAGLTEAMVLCEMLGEGNAGKALNKAQARRFAQRNGLVFLEGKEITEHSRTPGKQPKGDDRGYAGGERA